MARPDPEVTPRYTQLMVTPRARVEAAIALGLADRPPAASWGHTYKEEWSPPDLARVTIGRARSLGWDFVKFQPRATCFAEAFGAQYEPAGLPFKGPLAGPPAVADMNGWEGIPDADASAKPLADQVDSIGQAVAGLGPDIPVIQTVFSPLTVAGYLVGKNKARAARELKREPKLVGAALEKIAAALVDFSRKSIAAGAAGVFYAISGYASRDVFAEADYRRIVLPYDRMVLDQLPSSAWCNVLHMCGSNVSFDLLDELRTDVVSWSIHNRGNPGLAEVRDRYGRAVMGGLSQRGTLMRGPVADVEAEVRAAIESTGGRGLLIAPGCSVPPMASRQNVAAIVPAVA